MRYEKGKIVFLYSEIMGYMLSVINELVELGYSVDVVHRSHKKKSNYIPEKIEGVEMFNRNDFTDSSLQSFLIEKSPVIIYVSGWMDKGYLKALKKVNPSAKVVMGLDSKWRGTAKQIVNRLYFRLKYKGIMDYIWVPGRDQYYYARMLGYSSQYVIHDLLTANVPLFEKRYIPLLKVPKTIYYVGRFTKRKSIDVLIQAFLASKAIENHWKLVLIGNGDDKESLSSLVPKGLNCIEFKDFMQPNELAAEVKNMGVFCLPSNFEAWGVVVHEFCAAGKAIISSDEVGAASSFVKHNYNGFIFKKDDIADLTKYLDVITNDEFENDLEKMGHRSHDLSKFITPVSSACSLTSVLD